MHEITHFKLQNAYKLNVYEIIESCNKRCSARPGIKPDTPDIRVQRSTDMAMPLHGKRRNNGATQSNVITY